MVRKKHCLFALGLLVALVLLVGMAEVYVRWYPPKDIHLYLGEEAPVSGIYKPDDQFGITYKDWNAFYQDNAYKMGQYFPAVVSHKAPKVWAFFGNSFVHAHGMLADQVRKKVKDRVIFNLGRNEPISIRFAQVKLLLDAGLQPERIFMSFMPVDTLVIGKFPLRTVQVTSQGGLTYRPSIPPGVLRWPVRNSRIAFTAWVRADLHRGNFHYSRDHRFGRINPTLQKDLEQLFGNLAKVTRAKKIPVTILLIPEYRQVVRGESFGFQDDLGRLLKELNLDYLDPREAFLKQPNPRSLYIPDRHLSLEGNQLLMDQLLDHLHKANKDRLACKGDSQS